jgi:NADH:ubiquinone oxidoreductase subunit E
MNNVHQQVVSCHAEKWSLEACIKALRQQYGGISPAMIEHLKSVYGVDESTLESLIRWAPRLTTEPEADHQLVVCDHCLHHLTDLKSRLQSFEKTPSIAVTFGGCLGACDTGPNALLDGQLFTEIDRQDDLWLKLESLNLKK